MPLYPINESGGGAVTIPTTSPVVMLGPPSPGAEPVMLGPPSPTSDPLATSIATAADLVARQQDQKAADREAAKAEAYRVRNLALAQNATARMRADISAFGAGGPPAWFLPMVIAGVGVFGVLHFINRSKTRRR